KGQDGGTVAARAARGAVVEAGGGAGRMRRALRPAPRVMTLAERAGERRFLWRVLAATIGLHLVGGMGALTAGGRGVRPRPRLSGTPPAAHVPFDGPLR